MPASVSSSAASGWMLSSSSTTGESLRTAGGAPAGVATWRSELVPSERIRHTDKFEDANLPGEMTTTITFTKVSVGTELNIVQEGVPAVIPPDACYLGWQESLALLKKLVEPEIPDQP